MDDQQGFSRAFLESQGRILVPDYDSHSQSSQETCPKPQAQKKRNNSGNSKSGKKSSKANKQVGILLNCVNDEAFWFWDINGTREPKNYPSTPAIANF